MDSCRWQLDAPLRGVEIAATPDGPPQRLDGFARKGRQLCFDPGHPTHPHWRLTYRPRRTAAELLFEPLDFAGVEFEVHLPTARQRLEGAAMDGESDLEADADRLARRLHTHASSSPGG